SGPGDVVALAIARGIFQDVDGSTSALASVDNGGTINVQASVHAVADGSAGTQFLTGGANAMFATARGVLQLVEADRARALVINSGAVTASATAFASGSVAAAVASVWAVDQSVDGISAATATILNDGGAFIVSVHASAFAD